MARWREKKEMRELEAQAASAHAAAPSLERRRRLLTAANESKPTILAEEEALKRSPTTAPRHPAVLRGRYGSGRTAGQPGRQAGMWVKEGTDVERRQGNWRIGRRICWGRCVWGGVGGGHVLKAGLGSRGGVPSLSLIRQSHTTTPLKPDLLAKAGEKTTTCVLKEGTQMLYQAQ